MDFTCSISFRRLKIGDVNFKISCHRVPMTCFIYFICVRHMKIEHFENKFCVRRMKIGYSMSYTYNRRAGKTLQP